MNIVGSPEDKMIELVYFTEYYHVLTPWTKFKDLTLR